MKGHVARCHFKHEHPDRPPIYRFAVSYMRPGNQQCHEKEKRIIMSHGGWGGTIIHGKAPIARKSICVTAPARLVAYGTRPCDGYLDV